MNQRIIGYDIARALAVFGMILVNYKIVMGATDKGPNWLVNLVGLLEGRVAATFVVLAGAGVSLLSRKSRLLNDKDLLARDRRTLLKRALFLFAIGMLYTSVWPADILHFYGLYLFFAAFLMAAPVFRLWVYSGLIVATSVILLSVLNYDADWNWKYLEYINFWSLAGMVRNLFFNGFHPVFPWLAFLLIGMILGRRDLGDPAVCRHLYLWGASVAIAAEAFSRLAFRGVPMSGSVNGEIITTFFSTAPMPPTPLYFCSAAGTACALIAASIALGERCAGSTWIRALAATGRFSLTLYVAHVIVGLGILEAIGRLEGQSLAFAAVAAATFYLCGAVFAHLWLTHFKRGPLEAVMRILSS